MFDLIVELILDDEVVTQVNDVVNVKVVDVTWKNAKYG